MGFLAMRGLRLCWKKARLTDLLVLGWVGGFLSLSLLIFFKLFFERLYRVS
jgi:hypothetical protein